MMLAIIQTAEPDPLAGLRGNAGPVDVPWPAWVWWCIGVGSVVLVALLIWLGYWLAHRKPKTIPPTPRQIALRALEELRARAPHTEPYEFSVTVSDVLRAYVSAQYKMRATQQTSPEFLNSISAAAEFTQNDRELLAAFLERCDLLKFARITARDEENTELLRAAAAFVQGGRDFTGDTNRGSSPIQERTSVPGTSLIDFEANMTQTAEQAVHAARARNGGKLDYSEASLKVVDEMLHELASSITQMNRKQIDDAVVVFSAYIQEVARRQFGGRYTWHNATNQPVLVVGEPASRIALMTQDRVRSRMKGDPADNIPFYYEGFAEHVRKAKPGDDALHV